MMAAGIQMKQHTIGHVRTPGEGMPVGCMEGRKSPLDAGPGQTFLNRGIFRDVIIIVKIDKIIVCRRQVHEQSDKHEQQTNNASKSHRLTFKQFGGGNKATKRPEVKTSGL
jgi:hypothetical protein